MENIFQNINKSQKLDIVYLSGLFFLTIVLFFSLDYKTEIIFPYDSKSGIAFNTSHEEMAENFSKVSAYENKDGSVSFTYRLSDKIEEPFVGLFFHKISETNKYFDFSNYDEIYISISSIKGKRIPIYLTIDFQDLKSKKNKLLAMPLRQVINYKASGEYKLKKSDFEVPSWWLRYHGISREMIREIDYSKVNYILINSCQILNPLYKDTITIRSVRFSNSNIYNIIFYGILVVFGAVSYIFIKFKRTQKVLIPYQVDAVLENENDTKIQRIAKFIAANFSNPQLSSNDIQKELGISTREIGVLIKEEYGISFKAYVNMIRLHELKRLLKETELPVSDIAYQMGYNNISHFNRVFKKDTGKSPKEYREDIQ